VVPFPVLPPAVFSSDTVAAVEQAIIDGVDVLNFSVGGGADPYNDIVSLAFASAYDNGIFVAKSAGNSGPTPDTVAGRSPWVTTVAASTHNRDFAATLTRRIRSENALVLDGDLHHRPVMARPILSSLPIMTVWPRTIRKKGCVTPHSQRALLTVKSLFVNGVVIARVAKSFNVAEGGAGGFDPLQPRHGQSLADGQPLGSGNSYPEHIAGAEHCWTFMAATMRMCKGL
jgi:hypothetical protein